MCPPPMYVVISALSSGVTHTTSFFMSDLTNKQFQQRSLFFLLIMDQAAPGDSGCLTYLFVNERICFFPHGFSHNSLSWVWVLETCSCQHLHQSSASWADHSFFFMLSVTFAAFSLFHRFHASDPFFCILIGCSSGLTNSSSTNCFRIFKTQIIGQRLCVTWWREDPDAELKD